MNNEVKVVIMAGGSGTRLWPMSRSAYPKQFVKLFENLSLLQLTLQRNRTLGKALVIVGEAHKFIALDQINEIGISADILVEPEPKNTAACSIMAAFIAKQSCINKLLLLPADHYILDEDIYLETVNRSLEEITNNGICTMGIRPTHPHTGYGYIKTNNMQQDICQECEFVEKPSFNTATQYLKNGGYFWNSGIFACNVNFLLEQAHLLQPEIFSSTKEAFDTIRMTKDFLEINGKSFNKIPSNSIDYAIVEKAPLLSMVKADFRWNDLGSWQSLWEVSEKDKYKNVCEGNIVTKSVTNSYIRADKLTSVIGVDNLVIVDSEDALLVANKDMSESVKELVAEMSARKHKEMVDHTTVIRPWGYYHELCSSEHYKVKHIVIKPSAQISLQYHMHRTEHWVIISGTGQVTLDDKIINVTADQSVFIPKTYHHTIKNTGTVDLHMVEVQTGTYFGEDDIVRLEDKYGRR